MAYVAMNYMQQLYGHSPHFYMAYVAMNFDFVQVQASVIF